MTDDSQVNNTTYLRDLALADCTFNTSMGDTSTTFTDSPAKRVKLAEKLQHVSLTNCYRQRLPHIDVTDGKWQQLPIFSNKYVEEKNPNADGLAFHIGLIPCNYFMGVPHDENKYADANSATYTGDTACNYYFHKFNSINVTLKDFLLLVERDTSGGIQIMDNPIFEVRKQYYNAWGEPLPDGIATGMITQKLSDLNSGLSMDVPFNSKGYIHHRSLYFPQAIEDKTTNKKIFYASYWYMSHLFNLGNITNGYMVPTHPPWSYQIRLLNTPAGLTNVKIYLSYYTEMHTHMDCIGKNFKNKIQVLPYYGATDIVMADEGATIEQIMKKREKESLKKQSPTMLSSFNAIVKDL